MTKNVVTGDGKILDTEGKELSQDSGQSDSLRSKEEIRQIHGIMQAMVRVFSTLANFVCRHCLFCSYKLVYIAMFLLCLVHSSTSTKHTFAFQ